MMIKKEAFTLAEVMVVFVVIGVMTAILIPGLFAAAPEQELLKAKKAYNTLSRAVEHMTNSGPYDTNEGILDSTSFVSDTNARNRFFCNNLSEILNVKKVDCTLDKVSPASSTSCGSTSSKALCMTVKDSKLDYQTLQASIDATCDSWYKDSSVTSSAGHNFVTADNVLWGVQLTDFTNTTTVSVDGITSPAFYGIVCFDTAKHTKSDRVYGMGVRRDGKVLPGTRLQTLIEDEDSK